MFSSTALYRALCCPVLQAVNLRANAFTHFPQQLRVARHTAQELQLVRRAAPN